jgi:hypothetical protein
MSKVIRKPLGKKIRKSPGKAMPKSAAKAAPKSAAKGAQKARAPKFLETFLMPPDRPRKGRGPGRPKTTSIPLDALQVELDGPGAHPETVDALAFLRITESYFRLLKRAAELKAANIVLTGLSIHDKCIAAVTVPNNPQLAAFYANIAADLIDGKSSPERGLETLTQEAQVALRALPHTQKVRVKAGRLYRNLAAAEEPVAQLPWEQISTRARVLRIGGFSLPRASFAARAQGAFTLDVDESDLPKLGAHVWKDIELEAIVSYDAAGHIAGGRLVGFTPVAYGIDETAAWRSWFQKAAPDWLDVDDIRAELRDDDRDDGRDGAGDDDGEGAPDGH